MVTLAELSDKALMVSAMAVMTSGFFILSNSSKITINDAVADNSCSVRSTLSGVIASANCVVPPTPFGPGNPDWFCRFEASMSFSPFAHNDEKVSDVSQFVRDTMKARRFLRNAESMLDNEVLPTPRSP